VDVAEVVVGWASRVTTVGLEREGFPPSTLNNVRSAVVGSDVLSVAGFAFARDNCELIGLRDRDRNRQIRYVNYDNNPGLHDRVQEYAIQSAIKAYVGDSSGTMTMARALGLGIFGELPA
jgi:hypothetical protein